VVNEGMFGFGNGEVSFLDLQQDAISNGVFSSANGLMPGDIPFDLLRDGDVILLSVNQSSVLWVLQAYDFSVKFNILNVISPRSIAKISTHRYAVSSFANDSLYVVDLNQDVPQVTAIHTGKSTESMILHGNFLYVANWSAYGGNYDNTTVQMIHLPSLTVSGQIQVGKEPNSMVLDKNGNLWVLCSGGYMNEELPRLFVISTLSNSVVSEFVFSDISQSPNSLTINKAGDELYFLNQDIFSMHITNSILPTQAFIQRGNRNFYSLNASLLNNTIFATDAKDFQTPGQVLIFDGAGQLIDEYEAGIIPGKIAGNTE